MSAPSGWSVPLAPLAQGPGKLLLALGIVTAGCGVVPRASPLPPEVTQPAVNARMLVTRDALPDLADTVVPVAAVQVAPPPPSPGCEPEGEGAVPVFTLPEAVTFALDNNPRLRVAREAITRARGEAQIAFAPFLPDLLFSYREVGFTSAVQPTSEQVPAVIGFGAGDQTFGQSELRTQWTLWDFGRTAGRYGRAVSREEIAWLQFDRAEQTIAYETAAAYLRLLAARAARVVQEQALERARAVLRDTRNRREAGVVERDAVLRAEVQVSEARDALVTADKVEFDAVARLNLALGRNVSLPLQVADLTARPDFRLSLPECLEIAAAQRREIDVARRTVAAAQYGLQAVRAEYLPKVYVKGVLTRVEGSDVADETVLGAGLHFEQSLFEGLRRQGEKRAAQADVASAVAQARVVLDNITLEVNLAYREIAASRERIALSEAAVVQARENLRLVRNRYNNGTATPTDLVDAETALTRSQQRYYTAVYDYLAALTRLDYAMGRPPGQFLSPPAAPGP